MAASGLDHVNILTNDVDATVAFYESVLELKRAPSPGEKMGLKGAWLLDARGKAIVHLLGNEPGLRFAVGREPGQSTNAVHHIAFTCTDFAGAKARIAALGLECQITDGILGLRQIVLQDPNAITVEMNFTEE